MALLEVQDMEISVIVAGRLHPVVCGVSFSVDDGETLGIVGESGCGKSLTALAIMGLIEGPALRMTGGHILFEGQSLVDLHPSARRAIMGNRMAMIFQEPMTSLNPVYRIGDQIAEALGRHRRLPRRQLRDRVLELLDLVHIPDPVRRIDNFPHQLSGGQRQRVMIAMALACDPKLLIADEPTTALDVTVQKEILDLMIALQARIGAAVILISHDLAVIAHICHRVAVMYRGAIVESGPADALFSRVSHPYTRGLLDSIPAIDRDLEWLAAIPGRAPLIDETVPGCPFHPRCALTQDRCRDIDPPATTVQADHVARCHFTLGSAK